MNSCIEEFNGICEQVQTNIDNEYSQIKKSSNTLIVKEFVKKYPWLTRNQTDNMPYIYELLKLCDLKERFSTQEMNILKEEYLIPKITGLFKHGQTNKTGLCNQRLITDIKSNRISFAISKNLLFSNDQWTERFINELEKEIPLTNSQQIIMIISSKYNDLNGKATHCKSIDKAISLYLKNDTFRVIFMCSNKNRYKDIISFLELYKNIATHKQLPIGIQHDEAHNREEGIPSKRHYIEKILTYPYVDNYIPVTASYGTIYLNNDNFLWKKENLEHYAINYTKHSSVKSTSSLYSSLADARKLSFEDIQSHQQFQNYNITEFDKKTFIDAHSEDIKNFNKKGWNQSMIEININERRQMNSSNFTIGECESFNLGMNILDNFTQDTYVENDESICSPIILTNVTNFHIFTTPNRVVFTIALMKYALTKDYNPICIGLYRGNINVRYKNILSQIVNKQETFEILDSSKEMNEKISNILIGLKAKGENIDRPVLIMGNYRPTGESITFVNYKYGTIRSQTIFPSTGQTREMDYQNYLRICYMTSKFVENNSSFVSPSKWMIGYSKNIQNAINYELENDKRIDEMGKNNTFNMTRKRKYEPDGNDEMMECIQSDEDVSTTCSDNDIACPGKFCVEDIECEDYMKMRKLFSKSIRTPEDKYNILQYMKKMLANGSASVSFPLLENDDIQTPLNSDVYILSVVRTFKEKKTYSNKELQKNYRFRSYDKAFSLKEPYLNDKDAVQRKQCEILVAFDKYKYDNYINNKTVIWIGYRN